MDDRREVRAGSGDQHLGAGEWRLLLQLYSEDQERGG
ncbi:hypothetical protein J2X42_004525 [Arthrobacter sp. BE255]|nr:hypothetical protein [Arthrobacter sp. BE255]